MQRVWLYLLPVGERCEVRHWPYNMYDCPKIYAYASRSLDSFSMHAGDTSRTHGRPRNIRYYTVRLVRYEILADSVRHKV